jgi:hypothetical protein
MKNKIFVSKVFFKTILIDIHVAQQNFPRDWKCL